MSQSARGFFSYGLFVENSAYITAWAFILVSPHGGYNGIYDAIQILSPPWSPIDLFIITGERYHVEVSHEKQARIDGCGCKSLYLGLYQHRTGFSLANRLDSKGSHEAKRRVSRPRLSFRRRQFG